MAAALMLPSSCTYYVFYLIRHDQTGKVGHSPVPHPSHACQCLMQLHNLSSLGLTHSLSKDFELAFIHLVKRELALCLTLWELQQITHNVHTLNVFQSHGIYFIRSVCSLHFLQAINHLKHDIFVVPTVLLYLPARYFASYHSNQQKDQVGKTIIFPTSNALSKSCRQVYPRSKLLVKRCDLVDLCFNCTLRQGFILNWFGKIKLLYFQTQQI